MRLDPLFDVLWSYDLAHEVAGSEGADGRVYGQGTAVLSGRLTGSSRWSNFPRIRRDFAYPAANGVIELDGGDVVLFGLTGMSSLADGKGVHVMTFETEAPALLWLNDVIAVGEGTIDAERGVLDMRYYACVAEVPAPSSPG